MSDLAIQMPDPMPALVRHAACLQFEDLPAATVESVRTFLIDTFGVGVAGANGPRLDGVIAAAQGWGAGDDACVWVRGPRLPAPSVAFVNGYQIHSLEFDCVHEQAVLHPMATLLSAVMAIAERSSARGRPISGRTLVAACVVGVDVATFLGSAARGPLRFFRPAVAGGFGAAAAVARLIGLDEERMADALGIQYGQTSGTMQAHLEGSPLLGLQVGFASRAAIVSCDLAAAGLSGPRDIMTGRHGYFRLFEDDRFDTRPGLADLGRVFQIDRLSHKPYPSGRLTHGTVDGIRRLQAAHGFSAQDVTAIECLVPPIVFRNVGRPDIPTPEANYAKLCIPFVAASFLRHGDLGVAHFLGPEMLHDPATHALAARVSVVEDDNADQNAMPPQTVRVGLSSGARHSITLEHVFGHPGAPLTAGQNLSKFRTAWRSGNGPSDAQADALVDAIRAIAALDDVASLTAITRQGSGA